MVQHKQGSANSVRRFFFSLPLILGIVLCVSPLFANETYNNRQKIYRVDNEYYKAISYLYIIQGYAQPSTTGPWSADELSKMLAMLDREALPKEAQEVYDYVAAELNAVPPNMQNAVGVKFSFEANLETYTHTNTKPAFQERSNWGYGLLKQNPMLKVTFETWPINYFYGYFDLTIGNSLKPTEAVFGSTHFNTNILGFQNPPQFNISELSMNFPHRAFVAAGGSRWSLQLGRDRLSWGPGTSGNFVIGDNLLYHNMVRFTTYGKNFKYTFVASFFPHKMNYYSYDKDNDDWTYVGHGDQYTQMHGVQMFMGHRLEGRFFHDRLNFALTEGVMYASEDNTLDLQIFNPAMLWHNYYVNMNANSILAFELDYTPIRYLNIYAQWVIDEFAIPGEAVPGKADTASPTAMGYMLGIKSSYPLSHGILYGSLEGAYTDPYLYLRGPGHGNETNKNYGINFVVAIRNHSQTDNVTYDEEFLGYKYGGDAIVANLNGGYRDFGRWYAEGNLFYMAHGTHDKWTCWNEVTPTTNDSTPTTTHHPENHADPNAQTDRNAVSHTFVVGVNGGYTILKGFSVFGQLDYINIWNYGNRRDAFESDMQLTIGLRYSV